MISIAIFRNQYATAVSQQTATAEELTSYIRRTVADRRESLPLVKQARFGNIRTAANCLRHDANVLKITGVEGDYDGGEVGFEQAVEIARQAGIHAVFYSTPSHTTDRPRWRILAPLSKEYPPADRDRFMARLQGIFAGHGVWFDVASWALSQSYFVGRVSGRDIPLTGIVEGECIDLLDRLDETAVSRPRVTGNGAAADDGPVDEAELTKAIVSGANYHRASLSLLGIWAAAGIGMLEAKEKLVFVFEHVMPPFRDQRWHARFDEIDRLVAFVYGKEADQRDQRVEFTIGGSGQKTESPVDEEPSPDPPAEEWPEPLGLDAYHGITGEVVMAIAPHTESDSAALLIQFLVAVGNALGRRAFYLVEDTRHHPNLFVVLVGKTGEGRKGTSWNRIRRLFEGVTGWLVNCIGSGLSTGEGLITSVRDGDGKKDLGVEDKRLLLIESEFARPLKVMLRPDNILSTILRAAWDGGKLEKRTSESREKATGAHVSMIGHITPDELYQEMDEVSPSNGFGNRFLYVCTRRSKFLPFGGSPEGSVVKDLQNRIREIVDGCPSGEIQFDDAACELWSSRYRELVTPRLGMYGSITMRAAAQVARLSLIYALLDRQQFIGEAHLKAALEVWRYAEDSARIVFGDKTGDRVADTIVTALRSAGLIGMARSEIYRLYNGRIHATKIDAALVKLASLKLVRRKQHQTGGRPEERWYGIE